MLQFLADYRDALYARAFNAFLVGKLAEEEGDLIGQYNACNQILALQWGSICQFYGYVEQLEDEARETRDRRSA